MKQHSEFAHFVDLVALMGRSDFDSSLLIYLNQWIQSKYFSILRVKDKTPALLLCGTQDDSYAIPWNCGQSYVKRYHHYDNLYQELFNKDMQQHQIATGCVCADDIIFEPYRNEIYEKNGLIQRLCGLCRDEHNHPILFNLYRHKDQGFYAKHEIESFEKMIPALAKMIQGHLALKEKFQQKDFRHQLLLQQSDLTHQELEVCIRILKGMSYIGIAQDLVLKETTVKTYRNRAFDKLGINLKSQLFSMFIHS
ncbi:helix-turn-helix transcriptional regulator [Acinetobacter sp. ANC 3832]|nr:helix-turn-helix transcriptional regulator [Acinetobacter sp. ANC 3832]